MIIEGSVSVKAAILGGKRDVYRLLADEKKHDRDLSFILAKAFERGIPVEKVSREKIDEIASGRTHGGLIAEAGNRRYQSLEDCLREKPAFLALVEGVEDPFNLGYIMRSLYAAGCTGLILRERDWSSAESVIMRSGAGSSEYLNVVLTSDAAETVRKCRNNGVMCCAAMRKDAIVYDQADYTGPVLIAIGGEMRGLSSAVLKEMDQNIFIPYANDFRNALNAAGAAAVLGFEVFRQRRNS